VWQASGVYRGGEAKTDAKDVRVIADQSRMRGTVAATSSPMFQRPQTLQRSLWRSSVQKNTFASR
jgi:hypothetical protein